MADNLASFEDSLKRSALHAERFDHSLSHSALSVKGIIASLLSADLIKKLGDSAVNQSTWLRGMKAGYSTIEANLDSMVASHKDLKSDARELAAIADGSIASAKLTRRMADEELTALNEQLDTLAAQIELKQSMAWLHPAELAFYGTILRSVTAVYSAHKMINASLIAANSTWGERLRLSRDVLNASRMTGADLETSADAARALVDYGYDTSVNFNETLKLVVQMKEGLGVSAELGAEIAAVFEGQLNASARSVADAMTRVVNDTALAADNAARFAINIGRAIAMLRPGVNADVGAVVELVGRYEGALQKLGGQVGGFQEMLTKMTTPDGMLQAGFLGVSSPDFIKSDRATQHVLDSFAERARSTLGDSSGWDRALRLQMLAEVFGTTASQVNLMLKAMDTANDTRATSIRLEDRFAEQMDASMQAFSRLRKSLSALTQEAAIPLMLAATAAASSVAYLLESVVKIPGIVWPASVAMGVGAAFAAYKLYDVAKAFVLVTATAHASAVALRTRAAANAASFIGPVIPAARSGLAAFASKLPMQIAAGVGAALAVWVVGDMLAKWVLKQTNADSYRQASLKNSYEDTLYMQMRRMALAGDMEGIQEATNRARSHYRRIGTGSSLIETKLEKALSAIPKVIGDARFAREVNISSFGASDKEQRVLDELARNQVMMVELVKIQVDIAKAARAEEVEANKRLKEKTDAEEKDKLLNYKEIQTWLNKALPIR